MPHICMNCGKRYEDDSEELIRGCSCGSTLFLYEKEVKDDSSSPVESEELHKKRDRVIEEIDRFLKGLKKRVKGKPSVKFDLESIKVLKDGVYEINIRRLLKKIPLIIEIREGSYHVHLASAFKKGKFETFDLRELEDGNLVLNKTKKKTKKG